jgi:hypothetical protein
MEAGVRKLFLSIALSLLATPVTADCGLRGLMPSPPAGCGQMNGVCVCRPDGRGGQSCDWHYTCVAPNQPPAYSGDGSYYRHREPAYRPAYRDAPYVPPAPVMPNFLTTNPFLDGWNQQDREMRERERHRMEMEMMRRRY